jgi:hypothetical protein
METAREIILRRRVKILTCVFIVGLVLAGATAIPLKWELEVLAKLSGADTDATGLLAHWIRTVHSALSETSSHFPFMFYGTDWLAFGHFVIAIAFIGALQDPLRNCWLFTFGMISCALLVPYALVFGGLRGIPIWWRLVDCSFGVFGFIPVWLCKRWVQELGALIRTNEWQVGQAPPTEKREAARF